MSSDSIFSKLEVLWRDTKMARGLRSIAIVSLFLLWLALAFVWLLSKLEYVPPLSEDWIALLKYGMLVLIIIIEAFYIGAKYLQDIYEAPSAWHTLRYLFAVIFGWNLPKMKITRGQRDFEGDYDTISHIGGPGILRIARDNVVVLETLQTQGNVLLAGERAISRFDFVREIFSTEEQYGIIDKIETLTADGIQVSVQNVQFRFRIDGHFKLSKNDFQAKDYIPAKKAVTDLTYQRPADAKGNLPFWTGAVSGAVVRIIKEIVNNTCLDDLIAPSHIEGHPLDKLRNKFISPEIHERFKSMGVKFIACNIGEISMNTKDIDIDKERLKAWFVKQSGVLKVIRAQGKSESFVSHERGRTEGQAMLLSSIANALQDIGLKGGDTVSVRKNLRNILLTRTAQILEARTSVYRKHVNEDDQNDSKRNM
jgi:hypothetical protein